MIILRKHGKAIIELSSSSVKLLIGPSVPSSRFSDYFSDSIKTSTTDGLRGSKMDIEWYKQNVIPVIKAYMNDCKGCTDITGTATAVYRMATNREEIFKLIREETGLIVNLLSGQEEAELAPLAYSRLSGDHDWKLFIDQGRGSTELALLDPSSKIKLSVSMPFGNNKLRETSGKIIETIENIPGAMKVIQKAIDHRANIVGSGGVLTKAHGYKHGEFVDIDELSGDLLLGIYKKVAELSGKQGIYVSGADSSYGAYFRYYGK